MDKQRTPSLGSGPERLDVPSITNRGNISSSSSSSCFFFFFFFFFFVCQPPEVHTLFQRPSIRAQDPKSGPDFFNQGQALAVVHTLRAYITSIGLRPFLSSPLHRPARREDRPLPHRLAIAFQRKHEHAHAWPISFYDFSSY